MATVKPHLVLFSGGTACRTINIALAQQGYRLTRIVPAWDSGGSSKALRESFGMLPVGDIRQALMTMAHGEGRAGDVVRICNARLSEEASAFDLYAELDFFVSGAHPLLQRMPPELGSAIVNYLALFRARMPGEFDLRNGSIGNFILTGAYFANGDNINRAIAVFKGLCGIAGNVWPASVQDDIELSARLNDGRVLARQHLVTRLSSEDAAAGIAEITLRATATRGAVEANPGALEAIRSADALIFGPGSFYTSILPHLLVDGALAAIGGNRHAMRIFIGNILECAETRGATLSTLLDRFLIRMKAYPGIDRPLTHVLSNRELFPFDKAVGKFPYLKQGELDEFCRQRRIENISGVFEDAWTRGQHDGEAISAALRSIMPPPDQAVAAECP